MITSLDLASIVYKSVSNSNIKGLINGDVYLGERPFNSDKNDVVIGALSVPNTILQESVVLVNIYAKDLFDGQSHLPDLKLLNEATKLLMPLFKDYYIAEKKTYIDIEYQRNYKVQNAQEWVSVIRLKTRTINQ
ncbi:hypothetical protein D1Y73_02605 [Riemerella anatipestifer]|uniref:hypothetical protein n=1 Tax=Riemerella anatipestifer TaxID=34085 RepID=UPI0012B1E4FB|nr:hypothetical protein [Riemerella anatipestifer]MSN81948.1 hypothetical protein [Riemerella anatipestifer]UXN80995.1 hypothetical protein [Phage vB_RanS_PJN03]